MNTSGGDLEEIIKCYQNPDYPRTIRSLCEQKIVDYILETLKNPEKEDLTNYYPLSL